MNFDKFSQEYEKIHDRNIRIFGESSEYFTKYKVKILNYFYHKNKINKTIKLLDLGCGIGKIERYIFSYFPQIEVYGIDPSKESISVASSTIKGKAIFSTCDGKNIPFDNNFFDAVLFSCVLHHIPPTNRKQILDESYRILKENGYLFIFEHNPWNLLTRYVVKNCIFDVDAPLLNKKEAVALFQNSKFFIKETGYIVFFPKILKWFRKFERKLGWCPLGAQYFIAAQKISFLTPKISASQRG